MGLFIAQSIESTNFEVLQSETDLIAISQMDAGIGFDEVNLTSIEGVSCIQVTYDTQNETGATSDRLFDLVNEQSYSSPHIIILADDGSFVLADGSTTAFANGFAMPVGNQLNPFANNVCTIYDITLCGGEGIWVDAEGGGTTGMSTEVMLYHELSHCFHFVTNTTAPTSAAEEVAAEIDENDMRDVSGLQHRDTNSHNGGCGGGPITCCIIASLATDSPYSNEVVQLRYLRDKALRVSAVGDDFFNLFFNSYYSFSPEVTRFLGRYPKLSNLTKDHFVIPFLIGLETVLYYCNNEQNSYLTISFIEKKIKDIKHIEKYNEIDFKIIRELLKEDKVTKIFPIINRSITYSLDKNSLSELSELLINASKDEIIKWSLIDIVLTWFDLVEIIQSNKSNKEKSEHISNIIENWLSEIPVTPIWGSLTRSQIENELSNLNHYLFNKRLKSQFSFKLTKRFKQHEEIINHWSLR